MERLERLSVHVREAVRLANSANAAELRLALMLFDSAAELMMHRAVETELAFNSIARQTLQTARTHSQESEMARQHFEETIASLSRSVVSEKRQARIERHFGSKIEFLLERGWKAIYGWTSVQASR